MENLLRRLIPLFKLYNFRLLIQLYEKYAAIRYRNRFETEIVFRGSRFIIGKDVTLFPSVYLGTYEKQELDILQSAIFPENLVFWDIGANVGLYSVLFGKRFPEGQVVAFEPNNELHSLLAKNLELNNISNCLIERKALSSHSGIGKMFSENSRPGAGRIKLEIDSSEAANKFEITTGDEYILQHPLLIPGLIKIDVEGHEPEVIKGMAQILSAHRPTLTIEVFKNLWESERGALWEETLTFLFQVYGDSTLITDGHSRILTKWGPEHLTGGMQTLIFGLGNGKG
jgi:FkbM family methyltransferase